MDESIPASASELLLVGYKEKSELLRVATAQARAYKLRAEALAGLLAASNKRPRVSIEPKDVIPSVEVPTNPMKKHSPNPPPTKIVDQPEIGHDSDDEVPVPLQEPEAAIATQDRSFDHLSSILCAYKDKKIVPGSIDFPFDVCADLCRDEARVVYSWSPADKKRLRPSIISALRLVYPDKKTTWYNNHFLSSENGAATYWARVLKRRAEIWDAAAARLAIGSHQEAANSVVERIRRKIANRKCKRLSSIASAVPSDNPYITPERKAFCASLSSSDSDGGGPNTVDLSQSPPTASSVGCTPALPLPPSGAVAKTKLAKGPETYSVAEMKTYVRTAKAIRNVSEKDGHTETTAAFIDAEFSVRSPRSAVT